MIPYNPKPAARMPSALFLALCCHLLTVFPVAAQWTAGPERFPRRENWYIGGGASLATMNFQQNGAGAFNLTIHYDFLHLGHSSFSLGSHVKLGTEDEYGVSFPVLVAVLTLADAAGANTANFSNNYNDNGKNGYSIRFFSDWPLLLQYNIGLGARHGENDAFGGYIGGGGSFTTTGYTYEEGRQKSISFLGLVACAGLRFGNGMEIGLSVTRPVDNPIGPIRDPLLFQISLCGFRK